MARLNPRFVAPVLGAAALLILPFIRTEEGTVLIAAPDPVGIPTACHGFTSGVELGQVFTIEECQALLAIEIDRADAAVSRLVHPHVLRTMPDTRRAAYISLVYNIGEGNFARSTLLRKTNAGDVVGACQEFSRWVYAKGRKLRGLVNRRERERQLCLKGVMRDI